MALARERRISIVGLTRADVDIRDDGAVAAAIQRTGPRLVVNAAAYTAVDKAETEPDVARAVNTDAAGFIARGAARSGAPMLHISTDYVFDGSKRDAYTETDAIAPLGVYGRTKAEGEAAVRIANPRHVIMRTAWVYGRYGANFLKTMMRLAAERDRLRVVADQRGCPTATLDIAEAILAVDAVLANDPSRNGTFHFAGEWRHDVARLRRSHRRGAGGEDRQASAGRRDHDGGFPDARQAPGELGIGFGSLRGDVRLSGAGLASADPSSLRPAPHALEPSGDLHRREILDEARIFLLLGLLVG